MQFYAEFILENYLVYVKERHLSKNVKERPFCIGEKRGEIKRIRKGDILIKYFVACLARIWQAQRDVIRMEGVLENEREKSLGDSRSSGPWDVSGNCKEHIFARNKSIL